MNTDTMRHKTPFRTLPPEWEQQQSFNDSLSEWMNRSPRVVISGALHLVLALIFAAMPWTVWEETKDQVIEAAIEPPVEIIEEQEPEPEPIVEPIEEVEPVLEDMDVTDVVENSNFDDGEESGDLGEEGSADSPFDSKNTNDVLGTGGGAGSKMGGRFGGPKGRRGKGAIPVAAGLQWLADHQDADGKWDCDEFFKHDPSNDQTEGPGYANHDVGVTALALLAFLGDGHTTTKGLHRATVAAGVQWLIKQQDKETGLIGEPLGKAYVYDHATATIVLCEATTLDKATLLKRKARKAVQFISRARSPYTGWRYDVPGTGDADTSVTGWMIFAMRAAEDAGITIDEEAYKDSLEWFDNMTDPGTGRVGYLKQGSSVARVEGTNDQHPVEKSEALTAVTLLCRFFLGQDPEDSASYMEKHADLLLKNLPDWSDDGIGNDMYYWYYGSYAMFQMGNKKGGAKKDYWTKWRKAMEPAVIGAQRKDGASKGSWDPIGPWGPYGGRVYSTAVMVLSLEVYYRYARILGAR